MNTERFRIPVPTADDRHRAVDATYAAAEAVIQRHDDRAHGAYLIVQSLCRLLNEALQKVEQLEERIDDMKSCGEDNRFD